MKYLLAVVITLLWAGTAPALDIAGVQIEPSVSVNGRNLALNGSGIRKKFFVKVYIGSLYAGKRLATAREALQDPGDKLIRMNFLHSKVDREKIVEAFREGFAHNTPELVESGEARKFLSLFNEDFRRGDRVDLFLGADGSVVARHNGRVLGSLSSGRLARGILAIYLGENPADEELKKGMLGKI